MKSVKLGELRDSAVLLAQAPPRFVRATLYGFVAFVALLGLWSYVVRVPVVVLAVGRVRPAGQLRLVDSEVGGRVVETFAEEHQRVEQGQLLLKLDPAPLQLELTAVEREIRHLAPEIRELETLAGRLRKFEPGKETPSDGLERYRDRLTSWIREIELAAVVVRRRREELKRNEDLGNLIAAAELVTSRLALAEAESAYQLALARHCGDVERDLEAARLKLQALEIQRDQRKDQLERLEIRSPLKGTVTAVAVRHRGEVVKPGQLLYQVSPEGAGFVAEVWVPGHQAGFVIPGMGARVEIPTFPEALFGWMPGKVQTVSADVSSGQPEGSSSSSQSPPQYRVEILLERGELTSRDGRVGKLRLGLETRARLVVREERLLMQVFGTVREAFRWGS